MQVSSIQKNGLTICVSSSNIKDIIMIINVLKIKYNLNSKIYYQAEKPIILIDNESLSLLRSIITPYMHPSTLYIFYPYMHPSPLSSFNY
jgi:hypothetical protein